jgi:hypothetical protein
MKLHRPPEQNWSFRQPPEPLPKVPTAGCFLGPSGTGKTTTLISMLLGPYRKVFDEIHVFSPSVSVDSAWIPVKEFASHLQASTFEEHWDEAALRRILDGQREKVRALKEAKTKKPLPQCLIVVDDHADDPRILHNSGNVLATLFVRSRHFATSCWVSSQKLTAIASVARVNFRFMLVWRLRNFKEIQSLMEELSAIYPVNILHEMYETAISDEQYSFWYLDLVAKRKEDMFYVRFDHKMVLE